MGIAALHPSYGTSADKSLLANGGQKGGRRAIDCLTGKSAVPFDLNSGFRRNDD